MIARFIEDQCYVHNKFVDCYFVVIKATEYDDHWMIDVIWKLKKNDQIILRQAQKFSVLKKSLRDFSAWLK